MVDSFLMIPFIGTSLRAAATTIEKQGQNIAEKRQKLIDTIRRSFGQEEADLFAQYIPDLEHLDSYTIPSIDTLKQGALNIAEKRGIPTSVESLKDMGQQRVQQLAEKHVPGLDRLQNVAQRLNIQQRIGGNRLTSSRPYKRKWGTRRKSRL
jgi:hypothetical protein